MVRFTIQDSRECTIPPIYDVYIPTFVSEENPVYLGKVRFQHVLPISSYNSKSIQDESNESDKEVSASSDGLLTPADLSKSVTLLS